MGSRLRASETLWHVLPLDEGEGPWARAQPSGCGCDWGQETSRVTGSEGSRPLWDVRGKETDWALGGPGLAGGHGDRTVTLSCDFSRKAWAFSNSREFFKCNIFHSKPKIFFKVNSTPNVGLELTIPDAKSHTLFWPNQPGAPLGNFSPRN